VAGPSEAGKPARTAVVSTKIRYMAGRKVSRHGEKRAAGRRIAGGGGARQHR